MTSTAIKPAEPVRTWREFNSYYTRRKRLRNLARDGAVYTLSFWRSPPRGMNWLRVLYYHHVFDDERSGFEAHLRLMKGLGDFLSMDQTIAMLEDDRPLDGRYFCLTFDDGFKNHLTHALPILAEHQVPAAFFVPTGFIGTDAGRPAVRDDFFSHAKIAMAFLSWDDCRTLARAGMTIGSHTVSHVRPIALTESEFERELLESKATIEREVGRPCLYFSCPKGGPGLDFEIERDPRLAARAGYRTFLTTRRGSVHRRPQPMLLERDLGLAAQNPRQLRYFFSL
jgi:peptidoglycan/xylan/chitin deacetylase (PgdA/CDA1 family)